MANLSRPPPVRRVRRADIVLAFMPYGAREAFKSGGRWSRIVTGTILQGLAAPGEALRWYDTFKVLPAAETETTSLPRPEREH